MNNFLNIGQDLWEYLKGSEKPIVMYGMGNGADKILAVCEKKGITVSDFFASDGFVRGHAFHGKTVLSYDETKEKYGDFIVLLSFASSLHNVIDNIKKIAGENELYVPDVPVFGSTLFDMEFYRSHEDVFLRTSELFADEKSADVYKNVLRAKLTGKTEYIFASECGKDEVYANILRPEKYRFYADLGAYNGDTIRELSSYAKNLEKVYAFEPDRRNFRKLTAYAELENRFDIECVNAAAWDKRETLIFDGSGNRNSNIAENLSGKKTVEVQATPLDCVAENVDFIKYDVEGSETEALYGSKSLIRRCRPDLMISMYHRSEDMFLLPKLANELCGAGYKFYLRRFRYIPCWDLGLYCISE